MKIIKQESCKIESYTIRYIKSTKTIHNQAYRSSKNHIDFYRDVNEVIVSLTYLYQTVLYGKKIKKTNNNTHQ